MRNLIPAFMALAALAALAAPPASAQSPARAGAAAPFISSAELASLIAKAKGMRREGQALVVQPIRGAAPYLAMLEYREAATPPIVHENDSELFYVVEGSGTMILGGALVNPKRAHLVLSPTGEPVVDDTDRYKQARSPHLVGTAAEGGVSLALSKGELVIVPPHTVHWFNAVNGTLVMVSMHATLQPSPAPACTPPAPPR